MLIQLSDPEGLDNRLEERPSKKPKSMNFLRKFAELQLLMLQHNAGLTGSHPYASTPINWPFSLTGISFWTENDSQKQIYLVGNLLGWWACVVGLSIYIGILGADLIARRRGLDPIADRKYCLLPASRSLIKMLQLFATVYGTTLVSSCSCGLSTTFRSSCSAASFSSTTTFLRTLPLP